MATNFSQLALTTNLTLEQVRAIVTEPLYTDPFIASDYRIQRVGVHKDVESKLLTVAKRKYPLRRIDGCTIPEAEARAITQRTFIPTQLGYQNNFCGDEFNNTVLALLQRANLDQYNLVGTELGGLIAEMTMMENKNHLPLIAWFGNKLSANPEFNQIKGYFELIKEAVAVGVAKQVTSYQGAALTAGQGIQLLQDLVDQCNDETAGVDISQKVIYMTRAVYQRFKQDLKAGSYNSTIYTTQIINGITVEYFDGIEIRPQYEWDALCSSELGLNFANVAVLTMKQNFVWAINDQEGMSFEILYNPYDLKTLVRNLFVFGVQIDFPELICAAY